MPPCSKSASIVSSCTQFSTIPRRWRQNQSEAIALLSHDVDHLARHAFTQEAPMIRRLKSGEYRLYSRKKNPRTGRRRNLGTFKSRAAAEKHERAVQYFKRH
jgi:hypothetical protein